MVYGCLLIVSANSLIAVGDEEGAIRFLDSAQGDKAGFSKTCLYIKPHANAIMDMSFSSDDFLLATGSGDQTGRIIDVRSQRVTHHMCAHFASIKKVQFQPNSSNNIVATCSRDGFVNLFDLRISDKTNPVVHLSASPRYPVEEVTHEPNKMRSIEIVNQIEGAHTSRKKKREPDCSKSSVRRVNVVHGRHNDVSVTSLAFLPQPGREHLLVTSSEADACVKLWDMRLCYSARNPRTPRAECVSTTAAPNSHAYHRRFGLTSLTFNGDGNRLYTLCRDHTVYGYSTSHLVLGNGHELGTTSREPRRASGAERPGLGPIYAFRHPLLQVSTFYPKLAIRPAKDGCSELLAVGSSENCAVLFPTDERYMTRRTQLNARTDATIPARRSIASPAPTSRLKSMDVVTPATNGNNDNDIRIYYHGTPLIRGHSKEVTSVAWSTGGSLCTISDDFTARCWREDATRARELRKGGETEGRRWMCGYAEVSVDGYDDDDDE